MRRTLYYLRSHVDGNLHWLTVVTTSNADTVDLFRSPVIHAGSAGGELVAALRTFADDIESGKSAA